MNTIDRRALLDVADQIDHAIQLIKVARMAAAGDATRRFADALAQLDKRFAMKFREACARRMRFHVLLGDGAKLTL